MGHALVSSVGGFFVARLCLGISEAGNFSGAPIAIGRLNPDSSMQTAETAARARPSVFAAASDSGKDGFQVTI
jgi:hypothetical protein